MATMTGLAETIQLPDLRAVAPEEEATEGGARPVLTWACRAGPAPALVSSYTPSDGGAPRLVAAIRTQDGPCVGVWDTGTGAVLQALSAPEDLTSLVSFQRRSDGRPALAAWVTASTSAAPIFAPSAAGSVLSFAAAQES
jgi:hypothetical protein